MRRVFISGCAAVAIGILGVSGVQARMFAQTPARGESAAPASSAKITGQWKFNPELSADPNGTTSVTGTPGAPAGPAGGGGSPYGGGSGGPGGMGRRPGGGFGGFGGGIGGFGGGGGSERGTMSSEQTLQLHALMREVNQPPAVLNIVTTAQTVTLTTDEGVVRKFTTNGKKEKVDLTSADVETTTKWDQGALTQDMKVGNVKVTRSFQTTAQGNQLVITVSTENGGRGQPALKKYVYDKN